MCVLTALHCTTPSLLCSPFDGIQQGAGTWQQYIVVGEDCLLAVPDKLSDEASSQFWVNPIT